MPRAALPARKVIFALVVGVIAFATTELLVDRFLDSDWRITLAASIAIGVIASLATFTTRRRLAIAYDVLGIIWTVVDGLGTVVGWIFAAL